MIQYCSQYVLTKRWYHNPLPLLLFSITTMDTFFLLLYTLCAVIFFAILSIVREQYVIRQEVKSIPNTGGYPFIGVIFKIISMPEYERLKWYLTFTKQYEGGIYLEWLGPKPIISIFKPEYLEHIFPSTVNIMKGEPYELLEPWLGKGLLTSTGKQWFHDRKLIGPTFHFSILDQFAVILFEQAEILTKCLEKEITKDTEKAIDVFPFVVNAALDIICETAMGVKIHAQESITEYTSAVHIASKSVLDRLIRPWYTLDWLYYSMPAGKEYKSAINRLHRFTKRVINKRKAERQSQSSSQNIELVNEGDDFNIGKERKKAFLDLLLDQNAKTDTPLTDDEVRAQVDTFMFEGHDTTAVAITWTLFLLGNNLEYQEKVHEELKEVFEDSDSPASVKEISELKYLERVIKESLRLFPSVPVITRRLVEEIKLDNHTLPKGVMVTIPILLVHRNPKIWPDPLKFDPDRFLPENSKLRNPYAYIPFSAGPRNCIGQKFALLEEKIVLSSILRKWRVKSVKTLDTIEYCPSLILRPLEKVFIHFTPKK